MSDEIDAQGSQIPPRVGIVQQFGQAPKSVTQIRVTFNTPFKKQPVVVITSQWPNGPVGFVETITEVDIEGFTVSGKNAAANYVINWIAVSSS